MTQTILLGDDHNLVLETLKEFLEAHISDTEVITCDNFADFSTQLHSDTQYDLAIVDYKMPELKGIQTIGQLVKNLNNTPIAVVSGSANHSEVLEFFQLGIIGFLPKTLSGIGMVSAINLMLCGEVYVHSNVLDEQYQSNAVRSGITQRERDVLMKLHLGYSNKEIAKRLSLEEISIKVYVSRLCKKLGAHNRTQVVVEALSRGLIS